MRADFVPASRDANPELPADAVVHIERANTQLLASLHQSFLHRGFARGNEHFGLPLPPDAAAAASAAAAAAGVQELRQPRPQNAKVIRANVSGGSLNDRSSLHWRLTDWQTLLPNSVLPMTPFWRLLACGRRGHSDANIFVVQSDAGTGKSYVLNAVLAAVRSRDINGRPGIALACASTGLASLGFPGGLTAHKLFGLLPNMYESDSIHNMYRLGTSRAALLAAADLIFIDEAFSLHRALIEAINRCCFTPSVPFPASSVWRQNHCALWRYQANPSCFARHHCSSPSCALHPPLVSDTRAAIPLPPRVPLCTTASRPRTPRVYGFPAKCGQRYPW